jgi:hypothetical protein
LELTLAMCVPVAQELPRPTFFTENVNEAPARRGKSGDDDGSLAGSSGAGSAAGVSVAAGGAGALVLLLVGAVLDVPDDDVVEPDEQAVSKAADANNARIDEGARRMATCTGRVPKVSLPN